MAENKSKAYYISCFVGSEMNGIFSTNGKSSRHESEVKSQSVALRKDVENINCIEMCHFALNESIGKTVTSVSVTVYVIALGTCVGNSNLALIRI